MIKFYFQIILMDEATSEVMEIIPEAVAGAGNHQPSTIITSTIMRLTVWCLINQRRNLLARLVTDILHLLLS
jgi:hypothetical protein